MTEDGLKLVGSHPSRVAQINLVVETQKRDVVFIAIFIVEKNTSLSCPSGWAL